jgi:TP901 family phage tail tape measure protein
VDSATNELLNILILAEDGASAVLDGVSGRVLGLKASLMEAVVQSDLMAASQLKLGTAMERMGINLGSWSREANTAATDMATMDGVALASTTAVLGLAAGVLAAGVAMGMSMTAAAQFDQQMTVVANNTNMTNAQMQQMHDTVLRLGADSGASLDSLSQGYMHITNFGYSAADATLILTAAMHSAVSTGADVAQTANVLANVMHEFNVPAIAAAQTMDMIHTAAAMGNMTLQQLTDAFGRTAAAAAAVGAPFDQTLAMFTMMTRHGFDAAQATTQVADAILHIIKPSAGATKELEALSNQTGINLVADFSQAGLQAKGFSGIITDVAAATHGNVNALAALLNVAPPTTAELNNMTQAANGNAAALAAIVPNQRGLYAMMLATGNGAKDYVDILHAVDGSMQGAGVTNTSYERSLTNVGQQMSILGGSTKSIEISFGEIFLPLIAGLATGLADVANGIEHVVVPAFSHLSQVTRGVTDDIGAMLGKIGELNGGGGGIAANIAANLPMVGNIFAAAGTVRDLLSPPGSTDAAAKAHADSTAAAIKALVGPSGDATLASGAATAAEQSKADANQKAINNLGVAELNISVKDVKAQFDPTIKDLQGQLSGEQQSTTAADAADKGRQDAVRSDYQARIAPLQKTLDLQTASTQQADALDKITKDGINTTYNAQIDPLKRQLDLLNQQHATAGEIATVEEDGIHATYDGQIQSLQTQIGLLSKRHQYAQETLAAENQIKDAQLQQALLAAEGDPVKKAALAGHLATLNIEQQKAQLQKDIDTLTAKDGASHYGGTRLTKYGYSPHNGPQAPTADAAAVNALQLQIDRDKLAALNLEDPNAVGAATSALTLQKATEGVQGLTTAIANGKDALAAIPLQQQLDGLLKQEKDLLTPIEAQKTADQAHYDLLKSQLGPEIDILKNKETDALAPLDAAIKKRDAELAVMKADIEPQIKKLQTDEAARIADLQHAIDQRNAEAALDEGRLKTAIDNLKTAEQERLTPLQAQLLAIQNQNAALDVQIQKADILKNGGTLPGDPSVGKPNSPYNVIPDPAAPYIAPGMPGSTLDGPPAPAVTAPPPGGMSDPPPGGMVAPPPGGMTDPAPGGMDAYHAAAVNSAIHQLGQPIIDKCEQFLDDLFGVANRKGRGSATDTANMFAGQGLLHGGSAADAPVGARLYYGDANAKGQLIAGPGHAALKTAADVQTGSDDNGVEARLISTWQQEAHQVFLGWYMDPTRANGGTQGTGGGGGVTPVATPTTTTVTINVTVSAGAVSVETNDTTGLGDVVGQTVAAALEQMAQSHSATTPGARRSLPGAH